MADEQSPQAATAAPPWPGVRFNQPSLDEPAPDFEAQTTQGLRRLSDYRGQWVLLFSHPADFTPVCTSEFIALERARDQFTHRNCALLGLSVDSVYAHLAWIDQIKSAFGVQIAFPVIEDVSMAVAAAYGMVHPGSTSTATVRSLFYIDPDGILRAMAHYPLSVGRSIDEILRVLDALQATADGRAGTPEGWRSGQGLLAAPPRSQADLDRQGPQDGPWFYREQG